MNQAKQPLAGPHIRTDLTTPTVMLDVVIALLPVMVVAVIFFGPDALIVIALACASACLTEWVIRSRKLTPAALVGDGSAAVTGILLGLTLSPVVPWWMPVVGGVLAIAVGKQLFGGLGKNVFNPALVARAILLLTWPIPNSRFVTPFDGVTAATPLATGVARLWDLAVGSVPGAIGETSALAILLGGAYLLYRGHIDWRIPSAVIAAALVVAWMVGRHPLFEVLAGGLMLAAVFMATDIVTSPVTRTGRILFGLLIGALTIVIRHFTIFPEGVFFAVLLANACVPLLDRYTVGLRFGETGSARPVRTAVSVVLVLVMSGGAVVGLASAMSELAVTRTAAARATELRVVLPAAEAFEEREIAGRTVFVGLAAGREIGAAFFWSETGFRAPITLLVGVGDDGALTGVVVTDHAETPGMGSQVAVREFLGQFDGKTHEDDIALERDVSGITGATISARAVTAGIRNAVAFYAAAVLGIVNDEIKINLADIPDGVYIGTAEGFLGPITVEVTVAGGRIEAITVKSHFDTPAFAYPAFEFVTDQIIAAQELEVDVVSGATVSSQGLMRAVEEALRTAGAGQ
ncbi:MAG: Electron transport complex subunit RsxD [Dehalococcoidia bacterium]|nr:Electron transport complex subunit RsxD [Chloroflexota bacterium]